MFQSIVENPYKHTTWISYHFNVESTWRVCREVTVKKNPEDSMTKLKGAIQSYTLQKQQEKEESAQPHTLHHKSVLDFANFF